MINFEYAFGAPHTMTFSRPSASEKIVADVSNSGIQFFYQYNSLKNTVPLTWKMGKPDLTLSMLLSINSNNVEFNKWYRHKSGAPYLFMEADSEDVHCILSAIATKIGVVVKGEFINNSNKDNKVYWQLAHNYGWVISNQGWIDYKNNNLLLSMNEGRADRILAFGLNADSYPMVRFEKVNQEEKPPMANGDYGVSDNSMKKVISLFNLKPNEKKIGYYIIPFKKYFKDLEFLTQIDYEKEMKDALNEWNKHLNRSAKFTISDDELLSCYRACLADIFVMRERIGKGYGISCGTMLYRSTNSTEPLASEILLDSLGYNEVSKKDFDTYLTGQDESGCWAASYAWEHECWGSAFNKANAIMEHYYIYNDKEYLSRYYPRMLASTKFNYYARQSTKNSINEAERGLMPRGMGDCGMVYKGDYYGVFYPWNILCVSADELTLKAAKILSKKEDIEFLKKAYNEAKEDLIVSMRNNIVNDDGYLRTPVATDGTASSLYGCFFSIFPGHIFSFEEPMIQGTLKYIESKQISEGGLPLGMGWMKDGLWVAMALDVVSRTYLRLGYFEKARKYLYPALNHASNLVTYCEERGKEKGSKEISGDKQHLWTPLSICQYMKDAFWFEDENGVHLFSGICPNWLNNNNDVGVNNLKTHYGNTSIKMNKNARTTKVNIHTERPLNVNIHIHYFDINNKDCVKIINGNNNTLIDLNL